MEGNFNIVIPLNKGLVDGELNGIASATSVDRDGEKMNSSALEDMRREIVEKGVNLFGNHQHDWENVLGGVTKGRIVDNKLDVGVNLIKTHPKYKQLMDTLTTPGVKLGLSVGGNVTKESYEYSKELGRKVKVIEGVKLFEISVVGIPSNSDSYFSLGQAISKSAKLVKPCPCCYSEMKKVCGVCLYE